MARRNPIQVIMESELPDFSKRPRLYRPKLKDAKLYYKLLNRHIFENQLTPTRIKLIGMRDCWGYCSNQGSAGDVHASEIHLARRFPCVQFFIAVVAHEMIHQYQWEIETPIRRNRGLRPCWGHGDSFFRWKNKFKKLGIPLSRYGNHIKLKEHQDIWAMSR